MDRIHLHKRYTWEQHKGCRFHLSIFVHPIWVLSMLMQRMSLRLERRLEEQRSHPRLFWSFRSTSWFLYSFLRSCLIHIRLVYLQGWVRERDKGKCVTSFGLLLSPFLRHSSVEHAYSFLPLLFKMCAASWRQENEVDSSERLPRVTFSASFSILSWTKKRHCQMCDETIEAGWCRRPGFQAVSCSFSSMSSLPVTKTKDRKSVV